MTIENAEQTSQLFQRSFGRRKEDVLIRKLLKVGQIITSEINMDVLFDITVGETKQIMDVEHCTIFIFGRKSNHLRPFNSAWSKNDAPPLSPSDGIAGWVYSNMKPLIINSPYNDLRFRPDIDNNIESPFDVRNILSIPLINREKQCIGVYQAYNKMAPDGAFADFEQLDLDLFSALSSFVLIALENSKHYEDLRMLDKAKERVINHIAHEIKTPLAITSVAINRMYKKIHEGNIPELEKSLDMAKRNISRLLQFQSKIDDILNERLSDKKLLIMKVIEDAFCFVETLREQHGEYNEVLEHISNYIESFYGMTSIKLENIGLYDFLEWIKQETLRNAKDRTLEISTDFEKNVILHMDRNILEKTCFGLFRNAIENTPNEGRIEICSRTSDGGLIIEFRDYGVGITEENQKMVFGGFFHTQDTHSYSSKNPYEFNAGGAGSDLLRMKVFSERCGFDIGFQSTRCRFIPMDADSCPGKISLCRNAHDKAGCHASGGTTFALKFQPQFIVG